MIKKSQKSPSYFEGMDIDDELPVINRDRIKVTFKKTSTESGEIEVDLDGRLKRSFEIDYNFENFPTLRDGFIKRLRYLFLRDFSIPEFQNADLQDTKLSLIDKLDLGYGLKVIKISPEEATKIAKEIAKSRGEDPSSISDNPEAVLNKGYLPDFVYAIYSEKDPMGVFAIPFQLADTIYDLNTLDDIREFFIDLAEDSLGAPMERLVKSLKERLKRDDIPGAFERLDSGHLTAADILNYYNEKSSVLEPGSLELKKLTQHINSLIKKLHDGEMITKEDLVASPAVLPTAKNIEHVKDYRQMILLSRLEKEIGAVENMFEQKIKSESDDNKIARMKQEYFSFKNALSDLRVQLEEAGDLRPVISDIKKLLQKASDFIKK